MWGSMIYGSMMWGSRTAAEEAAKVDELTCQAAPQVTAGVGVGMMLLLLSAIRLSDADPQTPPLLT